MNIIEVGGKKYQQIEQPRGSWEKNPCWACVFENPCWDCVFVKEYNECHAPQEILDFDESLEINCSFS